MLEVEIPVDVESFITPDFQTVLHKDWKAAVLERGEEPWQMQPYLLQFLKELARAGIRDRTEQDWMTRIVQHFGLSFLERYQQIDESTPGGAPRLYGLP